MVAVDGSEASIRALVWAMREAADLGLRVEALTTWPLHGGTLVREVAGRFCEPQWRAREVQAEAVARALALVEPAPAHDLRVEHATLVDALTRAARRAVMVVIGSDGPTARIPAHRPLAERIRQAVPGPVVVIGPEGPIDDAADSVRAALHRRR